MGSSRELRGTVTAERKDRMDTRFYKIARNPNTREVKCTVIEKDTHRQVAHVVLHSPTGLETGYGGSGPADLAASILADFLNIKPSCVLREWNAPFDEGPSAMLVIRLHQRFKREFVETQQIAPGEHYVLAGRCIQRWIAAQSESSPTAQTDAPEGC